MAVNVGDILATFRVIDEATQPLEQIAGAQEEAAAALSRLTEQYTSASGPVENWNALAQEFTGIDLAAKANDMASAVEAIGGASRLTQKEQAQVNAVMEEALAKYQALGMEAPANIQALADATRDASEATKGLGKEAEGAEGGMSMLTKGITLAAAAATAAVAALGAMGAAIVKIGEHGSAVGDITEQFGKLAAKAGVDTVDALNALRNATAGTISDFDLMKASLPLLSSGFKGTAEDLGTMAEAARVLSERGMGLDEAMQMVTSAMTTGRTRALSMQGVVIDTAQSMKNLTDATNEEGGAVQESAKLHLKQQEILKGLKGLVQENGAVMLDFADRTDQVRVAFKNFYDGFSRRLSESEGLTTVFDRISTAIVDAFGGEQQAAMDGLLKMFDRIMAVVGDVAVTLIEVGAKAFKWLKSAAEDASSSGAWPALVAMLTTIGSVLKLVWDVVMVVGKALLWLAEKLGVFAAIGTGFTMMGKGIEAVVAVVDWAVEKFKLLISIIDDLRGKDPGLPKVTGGFDDLNKRGFQPVISAADALQGKLGPLTQGIGAVGGAANLTAEQLKAMADAEASMSGAKQIAETQALIATYDRLAKQGVQPTIEAQAALHKAVEATIKIYTDAGNAVPPALLKIRAATQDAANGLDRWSRETAGANDAVWTFGQTLTDEVAPAIAATANLMNVVLLPAVQKTGGVFDEMGNRIGELADDASEGMKKTGELMAESWGEGFTRIAKNFGNVMADAIVNGNWKNAFAAVGSQIGSFLGEKLGTSLGKMVGGWMGKTLGAILPGLGSLLGPVVGWLGDKLFKTEGKKVNDIRDAYVSAAGGIDALNAAAVAAGTTLDAFLRAGTVKEYEAAIADLEKHFGALDAAVQKYGLTWESLPLAERQKEMSKTAGALADEFMLLTNRGYRVEDVLKGMGKDLNQLIVDAVRTGTKIPAALQPILAKLVEMGGLSDAARNALLGISDAVDWKTAEELAQKYGGTLDQLGAKFSAAKLQAQWGDIWKDWQAFIDMGADVGGMLAFMGDDIEKLVQKSMELGTTIPEQFRPIIEELIRTGKLFDANGEAITDIAQLKFGAPLVDEVDKIIEAIDRLIEVLTTGLTGAIDRVPRKIDIEANVHTRYNDDGTDRGGDGTERGGEGYASGTHGQYVDFGAGTLVTLHGRERVMPISEAAAGGASRPIQITVVSTLDGREVARNQIRYLPSQLTLAGR